MAKRKKRRDFSEEDIQLIYELWPDHSTTEIAKEMGRNRYSILSLARRIREQGYEMPEKTPKDGLDRRIKNALGDPEK